MMVEAFKRRLTFIVGTSLTTGQKNTVVWAGIHHKTSPSGGPFGYPDNTYLNRVREELSARNIDKQTVREMKRLNLNSGSITLNGSNVHE